MPSHHLWVEGIPAPGSVSQGKKSSLLLASPLRLWKSDISSSAGFKPRCPFGLCLVFGYTPQVNSGFAVFSLCSQHCSGCLLETVQDSFRYPHPPCSIDYLLSTQSRWISLLSETPESCGVIGVLLKLTERTGRVDMFRV